MKQYMHFIGIFILAATLIFTACDSGKNSDGSNGESFTADSIQGEQLIPGEQVTMSADGLSFVMVSVPGGYTFPTGENDDGEATVNNAYFIGETEVTYELWKKIYDWATTDAGSSKRADGGELYQFENGAGNQGSNNGGNTDLHPVTYVTWFDSIAWCNALTEWYNAYKGTDYTCVYTYNSEVIRDSRYPENITALNGIEASSTARGFRLLSSNEWELAARWRNDATNTVSGYADPYFTKGNSASHGTTYHNDVTGAPNYAGKLANDLVAVYKEYYNGDEYMPTDITSTSKVKSILSGANSLGLYDMSGNVWEWCFDSTTDYLKRIHRGGSWLRASDYLQVGLIKDFFPLNSSNYELGFRLARTP